MNGVYFITNGVHVKIGKSKDIQKRLASLQTGSPLPLELLGFIPCSDEKERTWTEAMIHEECLDQVVHGEWFNMPRIQALMCIDDWDGLILKESDYEEMCTYYLKRRRK